MVYADNVKDWNNPCTDQSIPRSVGRRSGYVRHSLNRLPEKPEEDILPEGSKGYPKYLNKYPGKTEIIRRITTSVLSVSPKFT